MGVNKNKLTVRGREIYNEGIRDALKELLLYDGIIPDKYDRSVVVTNIQKKLSYKQPPFKPIRTT